MILRLQSFLTSFQNIFFKHTMFDNLITKSELNFENMLISKSKL